MSPQLIEAGFRLIPGARSQHALSLPCGYEARVFPSAAGWQLVVLTPEGPMHAGKFFMNPAAAVIEQCQSLKQELLLSGPPLQGLEPVTSVQLLEALQAR